MSAAPVQTTFAQRARPRFALVAAARRDTPDWRTCQVGVLAAAQEWALALTLPEIVCHIGEDSELTSPLSCPSAITMCQQRLTQSCHTCLRIPFSELHCVLVECPATMYLAERGTGVPLLAHGSCAQLSDIEAMLSASHSARHARGISGSVSCAALAQCRLP